MSYGYGSGSYGTSYYNYYYPPLPFEEYAKKQEAARPFVDLYSQPEQADPTPERVEQLLAEALAVRQALADLDKKFFSYK